MGKPSRQKGARGEREVRDALRAHGLEARRDGRLDDDLDHNVEPFHLEVKRTERIEITKWLEQAERDAGDRIPAVVFRRSREPWRIVLPLDAFLSLYNDAFLRDPANPGSIVLRTYERRKDGISAKRSEEVASEEAGS